jgi:formylglycine-generating enzyme required for sulfatase activity
VAAALAVCCAVLPGCTAAAPPPYGAALVVVDTDLPVPTVVDRLRIDSYAPDGTWFDSVDVARPEANDWPVSFGVAAPDASTRDVLVRLRAYSEGNVRDYLGERYQPPATFTEPFVPHSLDELCANAPLLPIGGTVTVRRGHTPFLSVFTGDKCMNVANSVGSAGARVVIDKSGPYCFAVLGTIPNEPDDPQSPPYSQVTLQLRNDCLKESTTVACDAAMANGLWTLTQLTPTHLDPGPYTIVVGGFYVAYAPTDVILGAAAGSCAGLPPIPAPPPAAAGFPLDLHGDPSQSPQQEPLPSMTVDRLVRVRLEEGTVGAVHVTLAGECSGTMSKLGDGAVSFDAATTCTDAADPTTPVPVESLSHDLTVGPTAQGSFAPGDACPDTPPSSDVACIPGGPFVLGSKGGDETSVPPRIAAVSTFWIDAHEVTVARLRAAIAKGLKVTNSELIDAARMLNPYCLWTAQPGPSERFAVTCISWYAARRFCQSVGGDLPTEAQWEYAATGGGGPYKTTYPWGYDAPVCQCTGDVQPCHAPNFGRADLNSPGPTQCPGSGGPLPVDAKDGEYGDTSPFGVYGLAGGVNELQRDSAQPLDSDCWRAAGVVDPMCWEAEAPYRTRRGGTFSSAALSILPVGRGHFQPGDPSPYSGFRCAYAQAPP